MCTVWHEVLCIFSVDVIGGLVLETAKQQQS